MGVKQKARESAERCIPLGIFNRDQMISYFVQGYMAGHAAHTRWASKAIGDYRDAAESVSQRSGDPNG